MFLWLPLFCDIIVYSAPTGRMSRRTSNERPLKAFCDRRHWLCFYFLSLEPRQDRDHRKGAETCPPARDCPVSVPHLGSPQDSGGISPFLFYLVSSLVASGGSCQALGLSELPGFHEPWLTSELKTLSPVCYCLLSYSPQPSPGSCSARFPQPALPGLSEVTLVPQASPPLGYGEG